MVVELMLIALILVLCIIADKFSGKFGMPALILFIGIGMLFGSDGIVKIPFDNFAVTEQICTIALGLLCFTAASTPSGRRQSRLQSNHCYCQRPAYF